MEKPENCIKFLVESTNLYKCDNDGYIVRITDNKRISINSDDEKGFKKDLILPKRIIDNQNVSILNPFNEILGETENQKWFFIVLSMSVSFRLKSILNWTIQYIEMKEDLPSNILKFISKFSESVDKKTKKEIDMITKDMLEFSNIFYNRKLKTTIFRSGVFEDSFKKKYSSVRKKTWRFLREIFCDIFRFDGKVDDEFKNLFKYKSSKITCPRLDSFLNVYLKIVSHTNEICDIFDADEYIIDTDELSYHIRNIDNYYDKLKWLSQDPVPVETSETNITNNQPINQIQQQSSQLPQEENFIRSIIRQNTIPSFNQGYQNPFQQNRNIGNQFMNNQFGFGNSFMQPNLMTQPNPIPQPNQMMQSTFRSRPPWD